MQFLTFEHEREGVSTIIGKVALSDVDGIVRQVVVNNVRVISHHVEKQHFPVVAQKLFLRFDSTSAQLVFQVIHHAGVLDRHIFILQSVIEIVDRTFLGRRLRYSEFVEKLFRVLVAVINADVFAIDLNVLSDHEVVHT